jgi:hypothetical protein
LRIAGANGDVVGLQVSDGPGTDATDDEDADALFAEEGGRTATALAIERKVLSAEDLAAGGVGLEDGKAGGLTEMGGELLSNQGDSDLENGGLSHKDSKKKREKSHEIWRRVRQQGQRARQPGMEKRRSANW